MRRAGDEQAILRKYLLQDLGEAEQEHVELRLLTDTEFRRRMAMAQDDLIDDFVAGNLSGRELNSFREHFRTTPERLHKLKFAAALDRYVTEKARPAASRVEKPQTSRLGRRLRVAFSSAVALVIIAALVYVLPRTDWLPFGRGRDLRREFARVNRPQETASAPLSELARGGAETAALTLRENVVREGGATRTVELKGGVTLVRLLLEVTSGPHDSYRASLETADGRELATAEGLRAREEDGARFVVVQVPAALLQRGAYQLRLLGAGADGHPADLGPYPFQVSR